MAEPQNTGGRFGGIPVTQGGGRFGGDPVTTPGQSVLMQGAPEPAPRSRPVLGALETAATLGTATIAEPIAGLGGIYEVISGLVSGNDDYLVDSVNRINQIRDIGTYTPRSQTGQQFVENIGEFFKPFEEFAQRRGEAAGQSFGEYTGDITAQTSLPSRVANTAEYTAVMMAPSLLGVPGAVRRAGARSTGLTEVGALEEASGVRARSSATRQAEQIGQSVMRTTGGQAVRGANFDDIQNAVIQARDARRQATGELFDVARNTRAFVPIEQASALPQLVRGALKDYDIEAMPIVSRRLNEMEGFLSDIRDQRGSVNLNALAQFRQRINRNRAPANDIAQNSALGIMRGEIDGMIDALFDADMISGDPAAVTRWREANQAYRQYREDFTANKVIRRLSEQNATPEEVRNWILGAGRVGGKAESGEVVRRLKDILGNDSPQVAAVRQDVLFDILEPMLSENPNINQFAARYDQFMRNNNTLARELFPESLPEITALRRMAGAVDKATGPQFQIELDATLARALFGHALAKGQVRIGLARNVMNLLYRSATEPSRQRQIMAQVLGYDPMAPVVPPSSLAIPSAIPAAMESAERLQEMNREEGIR